jgi:hypothetical protein
VDILDAGCQTVIPPTVHPNTHSPYTWVGTELLKAPLQALPEIDASRARLLGLRTLAMASRLNRVTQAEAGQGG